jgi:hypothetical protein
MGGYVVMVLLSPPVLGQEKPTMSARLGKLTLPKLGKLMLSIRKPNSESNTNSAPDGLVCGGAGTAGLGVVNRSSGGALPATLGGGLGDCELSVCPDGGGESWGIDIVGILVPECSLILPAWLANRAPIAELILLKILKEVTCWLLLPGTATEDASTSTGASEMVPAAVAFMTPGAMLMVIEAMFSSGTEL